VGRCGRDAPPAWWHDRHSGGPSAVHAWRHAHRL